MSQAAASDSALKLCSCLLAGARYAQYCAIVGRTYLINPSKQQEQEYVALAAAMDAAVSALKPGAPCSDAYAAVVKALQVRYSQDDAMASRIGQPAQRPMRRLNCCSRRSSHVRKLARRNAQPTPRYCSDSIARQRVLDAKVLGYLAQGL